MAQTQTQTHLGLGPSWGFKPLEEGLENLSLGPSWGPKSLEEGLQNLGLRPSWGPESLEEESTLAPTWQLKEEKIFSCSSENVMLHHDDVCLIE